MRTFALLVVASWWGAFAIGGCPPTTGPAAPPYPDADAACVVDERIDPARLIRTADGSPLVIHCQDGAP